MKVDTMFMQTPLYNLSRFLILYVLFNMYSDTKSSFYCLNCSSSINLLKPNDVDSAINPKLVSQATPFTDRKGLVMLRPSNCHRGMKLSNAKHIVT